MTKQPIILASHGTNGGRAAEKAALSHAAHTKAPVIHLYIVPDFWRGMRGDDWLNNTVTQKRFGDYIEDELAREAGIEVDRIAKDAEKAGVDLQTRAMFGKPADCLLRLCDELNATTVFIGMPRPKGEPGYNSRMKLESLVRNLKARLIIIPPDTSAEQ